MALSSHHYPVSFRSTGADFQRSHTRNKTQSSGETQFHFKETDLTRSANVNKWVWEMAKEWWYFTLISGVSVYVFRGRPGCLSIRAKFNTCRLPYPSVRLRGCLSVLTAALFSPRLQVSFCWKSRGCWKRRRWQRRLRVSTAGSLMWSSARPTCSGECLIRSSFFFLFGDFHNPSTCTGTVDISPSLELRWVGRSFPVLSRKAAYERGRSSVCMVYPGAYIIPQPLWFTWLYSVILFSRRSASQRAAGLS